MKPNWFLRTFTLTRLYSHYTESGVLKTTTDRGRRVIKREKGGDGGGDGGGRGGQTERQTLHTRNSAIENVRSIIIYF